MGLKVLTGDVDTTAAANSDRCETPAPSNPMILEPACVGFLLRCYSEPISLSPRMPNWPIALGTSRLFQLEASAISCELGRVTHTHNVRLLAVAP